jgi:hypothetical protein
MTQNYAIQRPHIEHARTFPIRPGLLQPPVVPVIVTPG